jgi:hypothetical protein
MAAAGIQSPVAFTQYMNEKQPTRCFIARREEYSLEEWGGRPQLEPTVTASGCFIGHKNWATGRWFRPWPLRASSFQLSCGVLWGDQGRKCLAEGPEGRCPVLSFPVRLVATLPTRSNFACSSVDKKNGIPVTRPQGERVVSVCMLYKPTGHGQSLELELFDIDHQGWGQAAAEATNSTLHEPCHSPCRSPAQRPRPSITP